MPNRHQPKTQVQDSRGRGRLAPSCHPERSEGSVSRGVEMLRGVYTERSECAQHDRIPLLSLLKAIPATPHNTRPTTFDGLFLT
jgi:hypothetical protein